MRSFLSQEEVLILTQAHHAARDKRKADRIKTVLFLNEGFSFEEAARLLLLDDSTLRSYIEEYQKSGVDKLLEDNYSGGVAKLSSLQEKELIFHLKHNTYQTVKEVVVYVKSEFGTQYTVSGLTHLLHQLGFVYKKTRVIPGKLNAQLQFEFVTMYESLKWTKQPEDKIYFLDSTHPIHNNMSSNGWIYKGEEVFIKTNTGRSRVNLTGALSIEDLSIKVAAYDTINAQATINFLKTLEDTQGTGILYCIVDNARYNRNKEVSSFLLAHPRIKLIFLPPYSPNLNIIERLWLFFHQRILYGHYYETFNEFKAAVLQFFDNIQNYQEELKTRLTDNFQVIPT